MNDIPMDSMQTYETQIRNEEYKIWKKYAPFYYDLMISHTLEWPSLTVDWLPINEISDDANYKIVKLVLGTQTGGDEQNYLLVGKVLLSNQLKIPKDSALVHLDDYSLSHNKRQGICAIGQAGGSFEVEKRISHEGEVNRARHMPQHPNIVCTKSVSGDLHIYDINLSYKHTDLNKPEKKLVGHSKSGFGLDWNPMKEGLIASGAEDGKVLVWAGIDSSEYSVSPLHEYRLEGQVVQDVRWNRLNEHLFASVGSQGSVMQ